MAAVAMMVGGLVAGGASAFGGLPCATLSADLRAVLDSSSAEEIVPVLIDFVEKADVGDLDALPEERRRAVLVEVLREHAKGQQARVREFLESRGGTDFQELWITNALAANVPAKAIGQFCDWPEIDRIRLNRKVTVPEDPKPDNLTPGRSRPSP